MARGKKLSDAQLKKDATARLMATVAWRAGYYRANPQRFCSEVLNLHLKLFQKILIYMMMCSDCFMFLASRGLGKTYLVALYCCVRCILYPGSKIVVTSATYKQAREVVLKITDDFMKKSSILCSEIEKTSTGQNDTYVMFKNGSWMRVYVATENSRGARANCLIVDESRLIPQKIIDTIFVPMLSSPRQPGYLDKPEYKHLQEMNQQFYLSSAYYQSSELYDKAKAYTANFFNEKLNYFICDLPYQLSIYEGLLMRQGIENEMSEATFSDISFAMEREGLFWGAGEDAFFSFNDLDKSRILKDSFKDLQYYQTTKTKLPDKKPGEIRIESVDIALLASRKHDNDASAILIGSAMPTSSNNYICNLNYIETEEGLRTEELGMKVMRYYYQYDVDYIALDANGIGQAVLDYLMDDHYDTEYGVTYRALNCCNNEDLAIRCRVKNAPKVIYAIKANAKSNNDMALALRAGLQNGYINLLSHDADIEDYLSETIKGYAKLSDVQKVKLKLPYIQTTFLIDEMINLEHDISNGLVKIREKSGSRKDRFSSFEYLYYVVTELSKKLKPKEEVSMVDYMKIFKVRRAPRRVSIFG